MFNIRAFGGELKKIKKEMGFSNILLLCFGFVVTYFSVFYILYVCRYLVSDMTVNKIDIEVPIQWNIYLKRKLIDTFKTIEIMEEQKDHFATLQAVWIGGLLFPLQCFFILAVSLGNYGMALS